MVYCSPALSFLWTQVLEYKKFSVCLLSCPMSVLSVALIHPANPVIICWRARWRASPVLRTALGPGWRRLTERATGESEIRVR